MIWRHSRNTGKKLQDSYEGEELKMDRNLKVGLTLIVMGTLLLFIGYQMLTDFTEREEDIERVNPEETLVEHESILALNFCGAVFIFGGLAVILVKFFKIDISDKER